MADTTVVIATHNRAPELARTLRQLTLLTPLCPVIVVDNASADDTPNVVADHVGDYPPGYLTYIRLPRNKGAVARNFGIWRARTTYVAFCDDDSWWAPDALRRAEDMFAEHPRVGLIAGRVLVGPRGLDDPVNALLEDSPLPRSPDAPGPEVLGFLACGCVARAFALRQCGGFSDVLEFVGEERLLAYELAASGWQQCYVPDIVAHHYPSPTRADPQARIVLERRNEVLTAIMRRPAGQVRKALARLTQAVFSDRRLAPALGGTLMRLPRAIARRRPVPHHVEQRIRMVERIAEDG